MSQWADHWTQVADLSVAFDKLSADPFFTSHIDTARIMAAGFSFGGWTAVSIGGPTGDLGGFVAACTAHRETLEACDLFLSEDVSVQTRDALASNAKNPDDRVTHLVAFAPGFVSGPKAFFVATPIPQTSHEQPCR